MSHPNDDSPPSDEAIRYIAAKGTAALDRIQATLDRAKAMLASGEVAEPAGDSDPHHNLYAWETTEPPPQAQMRIWRASADDFATGEGLTVWYGAGRARDEDEFRRYIALEFGRSLADSAKLGVGLDSHVQFEGLFLSDSLRATLARWDQGDNPPAAVSFFALYHTNFS